MQPKTADPLRAGISRALHIPLGQIKPATCCSIKSSSLMSHRLIMSLWDRGREKKDEGRRRVDCLGENSFSFPPTGEIFGEQLFRLLSEAIHQLFQSGWSFSLLFTIYAGTDI
jgi:hypothetical protein